MREIIKRWLGISDISNESNAKHSARIYFLENELAKKQATWQQEENLRNSRVLMQLVVQILDYLDLDYRKDLAPDPSRLREPEPMIESYTVLKRKKK